LIDWLPQYSVDDWWHCMQGRDFESVYTNHRFTDRERDILASHESFDYLPSHSDAYKQWLTRQPSRLIKNIH